LRSQKKRKLKLKRRAKRKKIKPQLQRAMVEKQINMNGLKL